MAKVLVVDADRELLRSARAALEATGHDVVEAETCPAAREALARGGVDVLVVDFGVQSGADGVELARQARAADPAMAIVLMSALDMDGWDRSMDGAESLFGVDALVDKPVEPEVLAELVSHVVQAARGRRPAGPATPHFAAILSRGIANERMSEKFYRMAAESAQHPETRRLLLDLAADEQEHARLLEDVRTGRRRLPPPPPRRASGLLEGLKGPALSPGLAPRDAFLLAIEKEKAAAEFYRSWAALFAGGAEGALLEELAGTEEGHRERLERMYMESAYPEAW